MTAPFLSLAVRNGSVLIDEADLDRVSQFRWGIYGRAPYSTYAMASGTEGKTTYMHRVIVDAKEGEVVDHINGDGLDNRRSNLRVTTHRLNLANARPYRGGSSRFKGVCWYARDERWHAYIGGPGNRKHLGYFEDEIEAARAYDTAAAERYGEHARLNERLILSEAR